jgi:hypothetical protein
MKHYLLIAACISTTLMHAMESSNVEIIPLSKKKFNIKFHGTTITLIKPSWDETTGRIDINVFGVNQEKRDQQERNHTKIKSCEFDTKYPVGSITHADKNDKGQILDFFVEEPCLCVINKEEKLFEYIVRREDINKKTSFVETFINKVALKEALKDLELCVRNVLTEGLEKIPNEDKSIALSTLGIGFPDKKAAKTTVATMLQFIKKFPAAYSHITLFVKKDSPQFKLYKELLEKELSEKDAAQ